MHADDGTFAEHILVKGDLQIRIPDNVSFEEAATLDVSITPVGRGLYQRLGLAMPTTPLSISVLISYAVLLPLHEYLVADSQNYRGICLSSYARPITSK